MQIMRTCWRQMFICRSRKRSFKWKINKNVRQDCLKVCALTVASCPIWKTLVSVSFWLQVSDLQTLLRVLEWKLRAQTALPKLGVKLKIENILCWCGNDSEMGPHRRGWDCMRNDNQGRSNGMRGSRQWVAALTEVSRGQQRQRGQRRCSWLRDQDADRIIEAHRASEVLIQGQRYLAIFFFFHICAAFYLYKVNLWAFIPARSQSKACQRTLSW